MGAETAVVKVPCGRRSDHQEGCLGEMLRKDALQDIALTEMRSRSVLCRIKCATGCASGSTREVVIKSDQKRGVWRLVNKKRRRTEREQLGEVLEGEHRRAAGEPDDAELRSACDPGRRSSHRRKV
eukprot:6182764-Pleurochrysis_carterae.AAC.1